MNMPFDVLRSQQCILLDELQRQPRMIARRPRHKPFLKRAFVVDPHWEKALSSDRAASADDPRKDPAVVDQGSVNDVGPSYSGDDSRIGSGSQLLEVASRISRPPPLC